MTPPPLGPDRGAILLAIARDALAEALVGRVPARRAQSWLASPAATFVSLHRAGELRGCVGVLEACRSLAEDVRINARAAAFEDGRFPPLALAELDAVRIEVSVLSRLAPLPAVDERSLLAVLTPGRDGLVLACGARRATFLPQVWCDLPDPAVFVAHLKRKAGLAEDSWPPGMEAFRYSVERFCEPDQT